MSDVKDARLARIFPSSAGTAGWTRRERELLARLREVRAAVDVATGGATAEPVPAGTGTAGALTTELLRRCLAGLAGTPADGDGGSATAEERGALAALLTELQDLAGALHAHDLERQARRRAGCAAALDDLRGAERSHELLDRVCPVVVERLGFRRATLHREEGGIWVPWAGDGHGSGGAAAPADAEHGFGARGAVAPVRVAGRTIGLLVADHGHSGRAVDETDRETLRTFASGFGRRYERAELADRVRLQREAVRRARYAAEEIMAGISEPAVELPARIGGDATPEDRGPGHTDPDGLGLLTDRQAEILRLMVGGGTNAAIAHALHITEGTVKSHVKRILRKLRAVNRSQAIAVYLRSERPDQPSTSTRR